MDSQLEGGFIWVVETILTPLTKIPLQRESGGD